MIPVLLACAALVLSRVETAWADARPLPYTTRTRPYTGWPNTLRGDIRTIGIAGAMVGLADSYIGAYDNPAGLAMTLPDGGIQFNSNAIADGYLQDYDERITSFNFGAFGNPYPWGLSVGYWSPQSEEANYLLPTTGEKAFVEMRVREVRLAAARNFLNNKLSIGMGLIIGDSIIAVTPDVNSGATSPKSEYHAFNVGGSIGALLQLPRRWLIGASYTTPMQYKENLGAQVPTIPGLFQKILVPYRVNLGVAWIPNRFFRFGFGTYFLGPTPGAALLSDDARSVGDNISVQPRLGAIYRFVEYKELKGQVSGGLYLDSARIEGTNVRLHVTGGVQVNPWIFFAGAGIDLGVQYMNYLFSFGVDVGKVMKKLDLVPDDGEPPSGGFFPNLTRLSDEGLPRPLVKDWKGGPPKDIIEIGKQIPERLKDKVTGTAEDVMEAIESVPEGISDTFKKSRAQRKARTEKEKDRKPKPPVPSVKPKQKPAPKRAN